MRHCTRGIWPSNTLTTRKPRYFKIVKIAQQNQQCNLLWNPSLSGPSQREFPTDIIDGAVSQPRTTPEFLNHSQKTWSDTKETKQHIMETKCLLIYWIIEECPGSSANAMRHSVQKAATHCGQHHCHSWRRGHSTRWPSSILLVAVVFVY